VDDPKNKLDAYMRLAQYWSSRHDARRIFESRFTLAWWGLLVLAIHYVRLPEFFERISIWNYVGLSVLCVMGLLICFVKFWLHPLWVRNVSDKGKALAAAREAAQILGAPDILQCGETAKSFSRDWFMRFQIFTTLLLLIVLCIAARLSR